MTRVSVVETKNSIIKHLANAGLFFGLFNVPTKKPHRLCICDDTSMAGNCWGKLVIEGRTWREVYEVLQTYDLNKAAFATRKLHEVPDNSKPI